ncbi:MAG: DUF4384 domain-containing protein, partial [Pseudomonadota bacterium]|nr:DUF4384 domain-containing protein [Pseudomonadota bacterium]
ASYLVLGICFGQSAWATEIPVPSDPVAKAAFDVLDKHCARCHQEGRLAKRIKPAKNFGNVLMLEEIAKTPQLVLPGNPDGSKVFNQIANKEMPYDLYYEADTAVPSVAQDDVKALRTWIESLGTKAVASCETRPFLGNKDQVALMAADLEKLPPNRVKGTRYLTLSHLFNGCAEDKDLEVYRQGAIKLVNSLSRSSDVLRLETIDPARTILRINIDDLGWEEADWNTILAAYPYGVKPDTRLFAFLSQTTNAALPYVRADWFAFTASQPPLYDKLLTLPVNFKELQGQLGLDIDANLKKFLAARAGFQKSGVSQNNRLIERHQIRTGYFWTSYDFAGNKDKQNLFRFPLGPGGEFSFNHDGGETIFSLPNGFQGYYLNKANGERLDKGPTEIVRDLTRKDLAVTNGISCMGCHDQGIRKARDDVRAQVLGDRSFPKSVRDQVEALYPPHERMDAILEEDAKRFRVAMERAGLDPTLKLNGVEMINALAHKYEATVDLRLAAAEFGMKLDEFRQAAAASGPQSFTLARRLDQGLVPRDQFEAEFASLVPVVTDDEALDLRNAAGGQAAAGSSQALPGGQPVQVAKVQSAPKELSRTFDLTLISDKSVYKQNEGAVFTVVAKEDCALTLINVDAKGTGTVLFPNQFQQENRIRAGKEFRFGDASTPFRFRLADKGTETVIALCNASKKATRGFETDFKAGGFTDLGDFAQRLARQIAAESKEKALSRKIVVESQAGQPAQAASNPGAAAAAKAGQSPVVPPPASGQQTATALATPAAQSDIVGRAAIKIEVQ